ncbi:type II CAAX endopeptidase family protein [Aestuariivirga litoralis]|uniref:type II CAAX endopeptidase family protein n=1 Tax=Aestuariivirga litoralis TaxID=2650924 RepID=UPI0018C4D659|nr:type II CAAX endopeptidase family protein [Aestuariivirga litoralis]MBG1233448.1 CPBP family intramembrane metalloprotease [Aestuariivirga litoralis]
MAVLFGDGVNADHDEGRLGEGAPQPQGFSPHLSKCTILHAEDEACLLPVRLKTIEYCVSCAERLVRLTPEREALLFRSLSDPAKAVIFYVIAFVMVFLIAANPQIFRQGSGAVSMMTSISSVLIMMLILTREGWSVEGWRRIGLLTAGLRGWWPAVLFPAAVLIGSAALLVATGLATFHGPAGEASALHMTGNLFFALLVSIGFAFCEEIGWRGYMLSKLLGLGAVTATLVVGLMQGLWHLPLMLMTSYYHASGNVLIVVPMFLLTLTLAGLFFGYLRLSTGSVWPPAIAHGVFNLIWGVGSELLTPDRAETMEYIGGESGLLVILSLIVTAAILVPRLRSFQVPAN